MTLHRGRHKRNNSRGYQISHCQCGSFVARWCSVVGELAKRCTDLVLECHFVVFVLYFSCAGRWTLFWPVLSCCWVSCLSCTVI
ncbi:hypothetical protein L228DRAFT_36167 [Xylona heveae TC161]|uniref:Uncharacterized protein n=1 Tax=Xylona heveae (strain CBS 132557 / TC161) TaxID=1328760 RepID=A0A164ZUX4_XYLHT|nr:hypothetical protein L228DRAFT_36167 [Xylona heveae TC161]KZF19563.1 hypothetical protein L228DRAFT_36167 [Xylona heveae TC161]